jgi:hypothetical protein
MEALLCLIATGAVNFISLIIQSAIGGILNNLSGVKFALFLFRVNQLPIRREPPIPYPEPSPEPEPEPEPEPQPEPESKPKKVKNSLAILFY